MTDEQFNQIVEAIISGKYSWACLLILRFAGYNPLHYIPYRTYNRLMKVNREQKSKLVETASTQLTSKSSTKLRDLCHWEEIERPAKQVKGGNRDSGVFSFQTIPNLILHRFRNN